VQDALQVVAGETKAHISKFGQAVPVAIQACALLQALVVRVDPVHELGAQGVALAV
jgi:hypothetical protein